MTKLNLKHNRVKSDFGVVQLEELDNGVVKIVMKDEEHHNTFSSELISGLYKCFDEVAKNNSYKVVILTGYGNYFCSGGTKEELVRIHKKEIKFNDLDFFKLPLNCQIPVISAMQGHGIGGGLVFGLYADLVVLSKESIYTTNFMKYGFTPGMGCTLVVSAKLGTSLGLEMMYTTKNYRGKELVKRGIPFPVVSRKKVLAYAEEMAVEMAEKPRLSLITLKENTSSELRDKLPLAIEKELRMHDITFHQPEVASRIERIFNEINISDTSHDFVGMGGWEEIDSYRIPQKQIIQQEEVLDRLQSGGISLENAKEIFRGIIAKEAQPEKTLNSKIDNHKLNKINTENSQDILFLSSQQEKILDRLQSGEISLENAKKNFRGIFAKEAQPEQTLNSKIDNNKVNKIKIENSQETLFLSNQQKEISLETDIAIIGISCRYPGARNRKEFWHNLTNGIDSITEPPPGRWEEKNWYHPDPENSGTSYSKYAGFLDEIDKFDPFFFDISPLEAEFMEPQQRIFLEEAYHAIEDAGYAPDSLKNKHCGVFVGVADSGYSKLLSNAGVGDNRLSLTGNLPSMVSARIAYFLDTKGPVVAIDTACSSSLVAVHQACESIQRGESKLAIAGGIVIMTTADGQILSSQSQMISAEGHCKTFDASASGTVWAEGCGVVLLKSYDRAIQDCDHIYGVIKGTGINYDGNTNGITAPSSQSQTSLEEKVYRKFGINPETISYVEAHGTATVLGDPIEVEALTNTFSKWTKKKQFCAIGSVKTNIGHAIYSAGISGLIKTALCLKNQKLVPSLHFNQANPHIDFENSPFYVNTELKDWKIPDGQIRRSVVSSFGLTGTNAHLVIEEAPLEVRSRRGEWPFAPTEVRSNNDRVASLQEGNNLERSLHLLTLSAKTEAALSDLVISYQNYLREENNDIKLADICYTANTGRTHFNHRLAVIASNKKELVEKLLQYKAGAELGEICSGKLPNDSAKPKIAFLFTGQGSQYVNMGRQLYEESSVFRQAINKCDKILGTFHKTSLLEILYPEDKDISNSSILNQTAYTQPAIFAVEYALAQLWQSWRIKPDIVMGHSVGEYVAATVAGIFSLEDGLKLIAERGRLMQQLPPGGEMFAVMASESRVQTFIAPYPEIAIAAINGLESVVISGESTALRDVVTSLETEGIKTKQLEVSHAFHSPLMEPMLAEFEVVANQITYNQPKIPIISNLIGTVADNSIASAKYWVNHVRQPVRFAQGMEYLHKQGAEIFLEIGPKPILLGMGRQCLPEDVGVWLPSLCPRKIPLPSPLEKGMPEDAALLRDEWQQMLSSLGELYVRGAEIDWVGVDKDYTRQKVTLPTYPFQRQRYWVETAIVDSSHNTQSMMVYSDHQNNIQSLINYLKTTTEFSDSELKLFDKIQNVLENNSVTQVEDLEKLKTDSEFIQILDKTPQQERRYVLINYLQNQIAYFLKLPSSQLPDPEIGFFEMGMDSLMIVELKKRIEKTLLISLSDTLAFNYPNISTLSSYIIDNLLEYNKSENKDIKQTNNNNKDDFSQLENLSEDEVEDSILQEIIEIETLLK
ncbi:polyketide synthase [Dapis sp. BLCC M229]|uniref:polyketide synthase n=1 Tax=Dapis sp. BLCC M229 TaxID=3400188 RepID=UPI003CEAB1F8